MLTNAVVGVIFVSCVTVHYVLFALIWWVCVNIIVQDSK